MSQPCILIVDDDAEIRELIAMYLEEHNFKTLQAKDGLSALEYLSKYQPDLILVDVIMPEMDGFSLCEQIRKVSTTPIIFLTSRWESKDMVHGLEIGGDDYITKPFLPDVLVARVKSNLRRVNFKEQNDVLVFGPLEINRQTYEVHFRHELIPFLAKEIKLLIFLAERPKQVFNAEQLYESIWEFPDSDARTVMVHISNIRRKLNTYAPNTVKIETIKGIGYRFIP